ncbi:MAG: HlyD family secretion protein [Gammaproteobacteria bacterium]|nr:HlyD family secretion protein [Gammaproteobacteria bacterium]
MAEVARIGQDEARSMPAVRRRRVAPRSAAVAAALLAATLVGAWWLFDRLTNVYVMDARVASDMILLSSRVAGWVTERPAAKGDRVAAGAPLLLVDARQARLRRDEFEAALATLDARTDAVKAEIAYMRGATASRIEAAESELVAARSELDAAGSIRETAEDEWRRADALRERNLLSEQDWAARRTAFRTSEQAEKSRAAQLRGAEADVAERRSEQARLDMLDAELARLESERLALRLQRDRAGEELADHVIRSPIAGVIDQTFIDAGEYVAEGQRVLMLHDPDVYWVRTNVKETDLRHLRVGKRAEVEVDAFPDRTYQATIARIGNAATSEFALLPNPNPSGNFTKITQRVEVKLTFDEPDPRLRPGLMVEVKIPKSDADAGE